MRVIPNLSNQEYHASKDYISSSFVKSTYKHSVGKALEPLEPNDALLFGDQFHTLMESDEDFKERFELLDDSEVVASILRKRPDIVAPSMTKDYKAWIKQQKDNLPKGKQFVSKDRYLQLQSMRTSVFNNEAVDELMSAYNVHWDEVSFFIDDAPEITYWDEELMEEITYQPEELKFRVRPDKLLLNDNLVYDAIVDWKTCGDSSLRAFRSDFYSYGYDIQAVFYCWLLGVPYDKFYFVAVEKKGAYNTMVYRLSERTIDRALKKLHHTLEVIKLWKQTGEDRIPNHNKINEL